MEIWAFVAFHFSWYDLTSFLATESMVLKLKLVWNHTYIVHLLKDIAIQGQVTELMDYNMFIHMNVIYWSYIRFRYLFYSQM